MTSNCPEFVADAEADAGVAPEVPEEAETDDDDVVVVSAGIARLTFQPTTAIAPTVED